MTKQTIKDLSIQVNLSGLSFCIFNRTSQRITYLQSHVFKTQLTPFGVLERLKAELSSNVEFADDFNSVQIIHHNELSTLVPKSLYTEANNADYLKFNSKILKTDFITNDSLKIDDIVNVYVPYININNYIFETFGTFTYKHASTLFIDAVRDLNRTFSKSEMHIDVNANTMILLVLDDKDIKLYNYFEFSTPEDFIYYILFAVEQLNLDTETLKLYLSGNISKEDDLFTIAFKYIRHVDFNSSKKISNTNSNTSKHENFILKHSF